MEKTNKKIFNKGEYIIPLCGSSGGGFIENYVYKQEKDFKYLRSELDSKDSTTNGWAKIRKDDTKSWRYATSEEIAKYDNLGKPYDVTKIPKESIKCYSNGEPLINFEVGKWYTNPMHNDVPMYCRVSAVEVVKMYSFDEYYNRLSFDKVADKDWNIKDVNESQANDAYDREMVEVTEPFHSIEDNPLVKASYNDIPSDINTYGLNVGDILPSELITDWSIISDNYTIDNKFIKGNYPGFVDDRVIEGFKLIDGETGFLVSSTMKVYLRAKGFKEYKDSYYRLRSDNTTDKVDMQSILEEAKRRYPIGTKIKCNFGGFENDISDVRDELFITDQGITHYGLSWVYLKSQWAEIISQPEEKVDYSNYLVKDEWYVINTGYKYLIKFNKIRNNGLSCIHGYNFLGKKKISNNDYVCNVSAIKSTRKATKEEVEEHFPNEYKEWKDASTVFGIGEYIPSISEAFNSNFESIEGKGTFMEPLMIKSKRKKRKIIV